MEKKNRSLHPNKSSTHKVRVLYVDTDQMGVVYHGTYLRWFEAGRARYMRARGASYARIEESGLFLPVVEVHAQYLKPARYDEVLDVVTTVTDIGRAQLRFDYQLYHHDVELVRGFTRHAAVSRAGKATRLPDAIRQALEGPETTDDEGPY